MDPAPPAPEPGRLVLVVEGDEAVRDLLALLLQREGLRTREARNGREALDMVAKERFDLVVTDLVMPDMGGYEFLRELQVGESRGVPIIVLSAKMMDRGAQDELRKEPNVVDFLSKPLQHAKFCGVVHHALRGDRPKR